MLCHRYMEMNGICCLLQLLRILELLDFQPRLGLVTKTIGHGEGTNSGSQAAMLS